MLCSVDSIEDHISNADVIGADGPKRKIAAVDSSLVLGPPRILPNPCGPVL